MMLVHVHARFTDEMNNKSNHSTHADDGSSNSNSSDNSTIEGGTSDRSDFGPFLSKLRTLLLRKRVADQLRQDFLLNRQLVELRALCRDVCTELGRSGAVLQELWAVVGQRGNANSSATERRSFSLEEDAETVTRAREILRGAVLTTDKYETKKNGFEAGNWEGVHPQGRWAVAASPCCSTDTICEGKRFSTFPPCKRDSMHERPDGSPTGKKDASLQSHEGGDGDGVSSKGSTDAQPPLGKMPSVNLPVNVYLCADGGAFVGKKETSSQTVGADNADSAPSDHPADGQPGLHDALATPARANSSLNASSGSFAERKNASTQTVVTDGGDHSAISDHPADGQSRLVEATGANAFDDDCPEDGGSRAGKRDVSAQTSAGSDGDDCVGSDDEMDGQPWLAEDLDVVAPAGAYPRTNPDGIEDVAPVARKPFGRRTPTNTPSAALSLDSELAVRRQAAVSGTRESGVTEALHPETLSPEKPAPTQEPHSPVSSSSTMSASSSSSSSSSSSLSLQSFEQSRRLVGCRRAQEGKRGAAKTIKRSSRWCIDIGTSSDGESHAHSVSSSGNTRAPRTKLRDALEDVPRLRRVKWHSPPNAVLPPPLPPLPPPPPQPIVGCVEATTECSDDGDTHGRPEPCRDCCSDGRCTHVETTVATRRQTALKEAIVRPFTMNCPVRFDEDMGIRHFQGSKSNGKCEHQRLLEEEHGCSDKSLAREFWEVSLEQDFEAFGEPERNKPTRSSPGPLKVPGASLDTLESVVFSPSTSPRRTAPRAYGGGAEPDRLRKVVAPNLRWPLASFEGDTLPHRDISTSSEDPPSRRRQTQSSHCFDEGSGNSAGDEETARPNERRMSPASRESDINFPPGTTDVSLMRLEDDEDEDDDDEDEDEQRSCALARKRALLRVRLARQRHELATAVVDAKERELRVERRRRREEKLAALLMKAHRNRGGRDDCGEESEAAPSRRRNPVTPSTKGSGEKDWHRLVEARRAGTVEDSCRVGEVADNNESLIASCATNGEAPRLVPPRPSVKSVCGHQQSYHKAEEIVFKGHRGLEDDGDGGDCDDDEGIPRKPLEVTPVDSHVAAGKSRQGYWKVDARKDEDVEKEGNCLRGLSKGNGVCGGGGGDRGAAVGPSCIAASAEKAEEMAGAKRVDSSRSCCPCSSSSGKYSRLMVVHIDALYAFQGRHRYFEGNMLCNTTGLYVVLDNSMFAHRTPIRCQHQETSGTDNHYHSEAAQAQEEPTDRIGEWGCGGVENLDVTNVALEKWIFHETVTLPIVTSNGRTGGGGRRQDVTVPERKHMDTEHNPNDELLRLRVYAAGEMESSTGSSCPVSPSRRKSSTHHQRQGTLVLDEMVGSAMISLRRHLSAVRTAGTGGDRRANCTFARLTRVSIVSPRGLPIGWIALHLCAG